MPNPDELMREAFERAGRLQFEHLAWLRRAVNENEGVELLSFSVAGQPAVSFSAVLLIRRDSLPGFVEQWLRHDRTQSCLTLCPGADNPGDVLAGVSSDPTPFVWVRGQPSLQVLDHGR